MQAGKPRGKIGVHLWQEAVVLEGPLILVMPYLESRGLHLGDTGVRQLVSLPGSF